MRSLALGVGFRPLVHLTLVIDRADEIKGTLDDFKVLLLITVGSVIMMSSVFLRDVMATLIASIAIPVSLCGTFTVLHMLGYGLDVISLLALMLATGFVVDDAVVVIENISRFRDGRGLKESVTAAAHHIGLTIVAITFLGSRFRAIFLFFAGVVGSLLREFAVALCTAILISGIVSLTLTPALCARLLWGGAGKASQEPDFVSGRLRSLYSRSLQTVMKFPRALLAVTVAVVVMTGVLFAIVPKGFLPTQTRNNFRNIRRISGCFLCWNGRDSRTN